MTRLFKTLAPVALLLAVLLSGVAPARAADMGSWPGIDHVVGKADAPNTIIEYFSLGCPHCADFHAETWPKLKAKWVDTGKAKFIFRDFPLDGRSLAAAMIAQCSKDHYEAFVDAYFRTQSSWGTAEDAKGALKGIARLGGMGSDQVDACWSDSKLMGDIKARQDFAQEKLDIHSTPTFFVNGKKLEGAKPLAEYEALLK